MCDAVHISTKAGYREGTMVRIENPAGRWIERCRFCGGEWLSLRYGEMEKDTELQLDVSGRFDKSCGISEKHEECSNECGEHQQPKLRKFAEERYY